MVGRVGSEGALSEAAEEEMGGSPLNYLGHLFIYWELRVRWELCRSQGRIYSTFI